MSREEEIVFFEEAEDKGRIIAENLIKDRCIAYEFQPTTSTIDLFVTGYSKTAAIEVKYRDHYTAQDVENFGGMYIKEKKYKSLMSVADEYTPYFCTIFSDYIYLWDLTKVDLTFHNEYLDVNCVVDHGKSIQSVSNLHIKDAVAKYETKRYMPNS